ncbi:MAG: capsid protein [Gemykibivirus turti1]|uniref:Capsid protein n=1 Tax=Genomoviridae sp. TaxID=2202565 RepID=A0A3G2YST0_9VIRU|nr:MAG: capsid protein [Genomoviridae sp.]AYP28710.1 MAG: capsid protein [Genomoviridae sp.]
MPQRKRKYTTRKRYGGKRKSRTRSTRRPTRSRRVSTRSILNKTSQKKRDHMLSYSNTAYDNPFSTDYFPGGAIMRRPLGVELPSEFTFIWNATGRPAENSTGQRGSKTDISLRTSESIFAVGLKERIQLETNNAASWEWRRICFTSKDDFGQADADTSDFFRRTSNGMVRLVSAQATPTYLNDQLFEGQRNSDWLSAITAPVSRKHFSIRYDRTRVIKSYNNAGLVHTYKMWHPMRKNIVYDGEQDGEKMIDSGVSVTGRAGMGNYYVVDIFRKHGINDDQSTLTFTPEASFYWHEK